MTRWLKSAVNQVLLLFVGFKILLRDHTLFVLIATHTFLIIFLLSHLPILLVIVALLVRLLGAPLILVVIGVLYHGVTVSIDCDSLLLLLYVLLESSGKPF